MAKYTLTVDTEDGSFEVMKDGAVVGDKIISVSASAYVPEKWNGENYIRDGKSQCYFTYSLIDSNGDEVSRRVMFNDGKCTCNNISAALIKESQKLVYEAKPKAVKND